MIQKFYSEARHCPHLSKALIIDPLAVELWTLCLIHRIPLKFSLYIRIKNVCPLLLNVTFRPFKEINLKEKKKWSKISENQNFIWFSQFAVCQSKGNAPRPIWMVFCLPKIHCCKNIPLFVYWWNSFLAQFWLTGCIHISRLSYP